MLESRNVIGVTQQTPLEERRREDRESLDERVIVTNLSRKMRNSTPGKLTDYSYSGVGLKVPRKFKAGTVLAVEWGNTMILGAVVHSRTSSSQHVRYTGLKTDYIILDRTLSGSPC